MVAASERERRAGPLRFASPRGAVISPAPARLGSRATLVVAAIVVFAVLEVLPGDPAALHPRHQAPRRTRSRRCATSSGLDLPAAGATRLDRRHAARRFRPLLHLDRAGRGADRGAARGSALPLALLAHRLSTAIALPARHPRRRAGAARRPTPASWVLASSASRSPISGSAAAGPAVLRGQAAAGCRPAASPAGTRAGPRFTALILPGCRAGPAAGRDPRARHALGAARCAGRGLSSAPRAPRA